MNLFYQKCAQKDRGKIHFFLKTTQKLFGSCHHPHTKCYYNKVFGGARGGECANPLEKQEKMVNRICIFGKFMVN